LRIEKEAASAKAMPLQLIRPTLADIPFIMATERTPGYEHLVSRSDEDWHRAALSNPRFAYFVAKLEAEPVGFAILRDWASPERITHLKRIAVARPGEGLGKWFLSAIVDAVFAQTEAYRFSLGLFPDNVRARRAYESVGFKPEGVSRGAVFLNGANRDELIMSMLRPEWVASSRGK
jgi:RimJ/RimL family protein N-acetyltransferase